MNARIAARRKKLFESSDYEKMLKMEVNEIARMMGEGDYKREIEELGGEYSGADLIERSLNLNVANTFSKLIEISSKDAEPMINAYLKKYHIKNFARALRTKKKSSEDLKNVLYPINTFDMSFEEVNESDKRTLVERFNSRFDLEFRREEPDIEKIERDLYKSYYSQLEDIASETGSKELKTLVENEYRDFRLEKALRLKKYGEEIEIDASGIEEVVKASDFEEAMNNAEKITGVEADSLEEFEHRLKKDRLERGLRTLHREPLGLSSVIGYIVAKETEVENLRILARARETGIENPETVRKNLVIA